MSEPSVFEKFDHVETILRFPAGAAVVTQGTDVTTLIGGDGSGYWGLTPPDGALGAISCRLIWDKNVYLGALAFLQDRSNCINFNSITDTKAIEYFFGAICNGFRRYCLEVHWEWSTDNYLYIKHGKLRALLTCNGSCGYVYASFWEEK